MADTVFTVGTLTNPAWFQDVNDHVYRNKDLTGKTFVVLDSSFGATGDGSTDDTSAIQAAIDAAFAEGGGTVFFPPGIYKITSSLILKDNVILCGVGDASRLQTSLDIEIIASSTTTTSTAINRAEIRDLYLKKTLSSATTKYDIHLQNPNICRLLRVRVQSGHDDNQYSNTNVGGVFLDRPAGSTATAFMNSLKDCWIQNNSIRFDTITDSEITGGFVWGHTREFAIKLYNCGNIQIQGILGIITSQYNGGIWLSGTALNQIRILDNEWDGNPLLARGDGLYCPQACATTIVSNNHFWGCGKNGINLTDPTGWTISGNSFWKNNDSDNSYDDIRITGVNLQPTGNIITGNTFLMDVSRTNKGYGIKEVNGGFNPVSNIFSNNSFAGSGYQSPAILLVNQTGQESTCINNVGVGTDVLSQTGRMFLSPCGKIASVQNVVNASGTVSLTINTSTYSGSPGSFAGILVVSSTRYNAPTQSRRTVYAVVGYGTTATFTSLSTQDGSGGGSSFTVTMSSAGVITATDTSGQQVDLRMSFSGLQGLA